MPTLTPLTITPGQLRWSALVAQLQVGITCPAVGAHTIQQFLVDDLALDPGYVARRVQTVFLDGSVVDDLDVARLHDGATLSLSAAMPGLVGATLRRGGYYARMRADVSWHDGAEPERGASGAPGTILVKLYNLLIREIAPSLLRRGVLVTPGAAGRLFDLGPDDLGRLPADPDELALLRLRDEPCA